MKNLIKVTNETQTWYFTVDEEWATEFKKNVEHANTSVTSVQVEILTYPVPLEKLPDEIQAKAKDILKAFDTVHVNYENGSFEVTTLTYLTAYRPDDRMVCGTYNAKEVYTAEERKQNFFESFGYYPYFKV